ncbi:hypothetical protein [Microbacterium aurantiacum]|uniref:hypothetical protein n=1 Tax=Microbacterium aurantiacum TaxID=162393 RepID=UPI0011AF503A|nr:hypothetical protein [Microbacterium aurantiacum]
MRLPAAAGLLMAAMVLAGCAHEPEVEAHLVEESEPEPERLGTPAQSLTNTCVTASADNPSQFESAVLTTDAENLIVAFKFERPFTLKTGEPYSISMGTGARLIVEVGPVRAYAFLNVDYESKPSRTWFATVWSAATSSQMPLSMMTATS